MLDIERRRLTLSGLAPGEVSRQMQGLAQLYDEYLNGKKTPGQIVREQPRLAKLWDDAPGHQYGRPAAFYQQLQDTNLAEAWQKVSAPVLSIHGEYDWIMSREDHELIAAWVNRNRPGAGRFVSIRRWTRLPPLCLAEAAFRGGGVFAEDVSGLFVHESCEVAVPTSRAVASSISRRRRGLIFGAQETTRFRQLGKGAAACAALPQMARCPLGSSRRLRRRPHLPPETEAKLPARVITAVGPDIR